MNCRCNGFCFVRFINHRIYISAYCPFPHKKYDYEGCAVSVYGWYSEDIVCTLPQNRADKLTAYLQENWISPLADKGAEGFIGGQNNRFLMEFSNGETAAPGECGDYLYWNGAFYRCASDTSLFRSTLF